MRFGRGSSGSSGLAGGSLNGPLDCCRIFPVENVRDQQVLDGFNLLDLIQLRKGFQAGELRRQRCLERAS